MSRSQPKAPSKQRSAAAADVAPNLAALNTVLAATPYIGGFAPSRKDCETFAGLAQDEGLPSNVLRWLTHIRSFSAAERAAWT